MSECVFREFRLVHCPDCDENMIYKKFLKHACALGKDLDKMQLEWSEIKNVLAQVCNSQKVILDLVQGLAADDEQNIATSSMAPSSYVNANIMVIGGRDADEYLSSVEVLYPGGKTWTVLEPMQESRCSAASVLYGNDVIACGGRCNEGVRDTMERLSLVCRPLRWIPFPVNLPLKSYGHKTAVINNCLYVIGGDDGVNVHNTIHSISLQHPYTRELKCEMNKSVCFHGLQALEDLLFVIGGSRSTSSINAVPTVLLYNTVNNEVSVIKPLPFAVCDVATVRWNENVIILGGTTCSGLSLNTVILFNMKENRHRMLPSMRHARSSCAATIAGNKVVVMGGFDWFEKKYIDSVECFDLDHQVWEELPAMNECRSEATAVLYAGLI